MKRITRAHREAAVLAMYPHCQNDSPMWVEFVEGGDTAGYPKITAVAQAIANASLSELEAGRSVVNAEAMTWIRQHGAVVMLAVSGPAREELRAVIERDADVRQIEEYGT